MTQNSEQNQKQADQNKGNTSNLDDLEANLELEDQNENQEHRIDHE